MPSAILLQFDSLLQDASRSPRESGTALEVCRHSQRKSLDLETQPLPSLNLLVARPKPATAPRLPIQILDTPFSAKKMPQPKSQLAQKIKETKLEKFSAPEKVAESSLMKTTPTTTLTEALRRHRGVSGIWSKMPNRPDPSLTLWESMGTSAQDKAKEKIATPTSPRLKRRAEVSVISQNHATKTSVAKNSAATASDLLSRDVSALESLFARAAEK